jgi:hypothetical protein
MEQLVKSEFAGDMKVIRETWNQCRFTTTNRTSHEMGSNPGYCSGKLATKR